MTENNIIQPVFCEKCKCDSLILKGLVWDSERKEFRIAINCPVCRNFGILIIKPKKDGSNQEFKDSNYIG